MKDKENIITFDGPFKEQCTKFIQYKRSLGFKYSNGPDLAVKRMDEFFKKYDLKDVILTKEMVEDFICKKGNESNNTVYKRQHLIKDFAIFLKNDNYENVYIFNDKYIDGRSYYIPYVFTHNEISEIFETLDNLKYCYRSKNYHKIYPVLIKLIYSCGLRLNEALLLKVKDFETENGVISIINGKENISRLVPLSNSMYNVLTKYIEDMDLNENDYLFPAPDGGKYDKSAVYHQFKKVLKRLSIDKRANVHSLRHTFSVHSLEKMLSEGQDVYCSLPILSRYLGHSNITSTEYYLRLTKENYENVTNVSILSTMKGGSL